MKVREIMNAPAIVVREDCTLQEAAETMLAKNIGCLPVVNDAGDIAGIVTESDFAAREAEIPFSLFRFPQVFGRWMPPEGVEQVYEAARRTTVRRIMTRPVVFVEEDDSLETLLEKMLRGRFHRLPVVRGRKPVGVAAQHDLLRLLCGRPLSGIAG